MINSQPIRVQEAQADIDFLLELNKKLVSTIGGDSDEPEYIWHTCKAEDKIGRFGMYYGTGVLDEKLYNGTLVEHEDINKYLAFLHRRLGLSTTMVLFLSKIIKISFGISSHVIGGGNVTGGYPLIKAGSVEAGDIHMAIIMPGLFIIIEGTVQCGYSH